MIGITFAWWGNTHNVYSAPPLNYVQAVPHDSDTLLCSPALSLAAGFNGFFSSNHDLAKMEAKALAQASGKQS